MIKKLLLISLFFLAFACQDSTKESRLLVNEGIKLLYDSKDTEALQKFDEAIKIKSDFAEAYNWRAMANFSLKNLELVMEDLDKAIELNPNYGEAYKNRGQLKSSLNDRDGACQDFLKAEELGIPNLYNFTKNCR